MVEDNGALKTDRVSLAGRLHDVSAALTPGRITAICGPNGAGKSTLLSVLAGLLSPERGAVSLDGSALSAASPRARARAIGYLPQTPEIAWDVTVETLVDLGRLPWRGGPLARARSAGAEDREAIEAALAAMELEDLRTRPLSRLSGGERSRALMARVLAGAPQWILADEPLANLDLAHQLALLKLLRRAADRGIGIVLVMHDLALAMNHADEVLVLDEGRRVTMAAPVEALSEPVLHDVWGVRARWVGERGNFALALG